MLNEIILQIASWITCSTSVSAVFGQSTTSTYTVQLQYVIYSGGGIGHIYTLNYTELQKPLTISPQTK